MGTRTRRGFALIVVALAVTVLLAGGNAGAVAGCQYPPASVVCYEVGEGNGATVLALTNNVGAQAAVAYFAQTGAYVYLNGNYTGAVTRCDDNTHTHVIRIWVNAQSPGTVFDTGVAC